MIMFVSVVIVVIAVIVMMMVVMVVLLMAVMGSLFASPLSTWNQRVTVMVLANNGYGNRESWL
jgi:hypothetical protein